MRIEKTLSNTCPIGLLAEYDLMGRLPERRKEIIGQAVDTRADKKLMLKQTLHAYTWHPLNTTKVMLLVGLLVFELVMLVSGVSMLGHWYAQAKNSTISVPVPLIQSMDINLGSYLPSSTYITMTEQLPTISLLQAVYIALAAMLLVLLEKGVIMAVHWEKVKHLRAAMKACDEEIALLEKWQSGD